MSGADAFMVKPFKARDLLNSIEGVLAGKGRALSSSNGRLNTLNDNIRALAAVSDPMLKIVKAATRETGITLEFSRDFDDAFKRLDREKFGLLICEAAIPKFSVRAVSDYMRYFALNIPVLLLGAEHIAEPRFLFLPGDASAEQIAQVLRDSLQRAR
jgi:DNA-binding response OmpR family regulator